MAQLLERQTYIWKGAGSNRSMEFFSSCFIDTQRHRLADSVSINLMLKDAIQ